MKQILLLVVSVLLLASCSSNERMVKKFVSRINADEYDASSVYIFPDDRAKLDFFARNVKQRCKTTFFKVNDCETIEENGEEAVKVVFQVENANDFIRTYFEQIGKPLAADNTFTDVIPIRETKDGECLAFTWALPGVDGSHLMVASIQSGNNVSNMNIRRGPGTKYPIEGTLGRGDKITIDESSSTEKWVHAYVVNDDGYVCQGYIYRNALGTTSNVYFSIGLFDSMALVVAVIIIVAIAFLLVFGSSIFAMISGIPAGGILIDIALILGLIYTVYQCLEKILFELFIINLPY